MRKIVQTVYYISLHIYDCLITWIYTAVQSQKAVTSYLKSKRLLHFDFAKQYWGVVVRCQLDGEFLFHLRHIFLCHSAIHVLN